MFDNLTGLGYGIIVFAILIGVGSVILYNFGGAVAQCQVITDGAWNASTGQCYNGTDSASPTNTAWVSNNYLLGQLGSNGLAGWTPAIIAIAVGLMFLGAFMINGGGKSRGRY